MALSGVQRVFAVDSSNRVRANIAYIKNEKGVYGAYYGHSGGGAYDDGFFFINLKEKVIVSSDISDLPKQAAKICNELAWVRDELTDHEEYEGGISTMGDALKNKGTVLHSANGWEHRSSRVTLKVLRLVSSHWGLSFRWN